MGNFRVDERVADYVGIFTVSYIYICSESKKDTVKVLGILFEC